MQRLPPRRKRPCGGHCLLLTYGALAAAASGALLLYARPRAPARAAPRQPPSAAPRQGKAPPTPAPTPDRGNEEEGAEAVPAEGGFRDLEERIRATVPASHWGPAEPPEESAQVRQKTGCDIYTVPFDPSRDANCVGYLLDEANWKEVRPVGQAYDERTVKFRVHYKDAPLQALVKVPQRMFPYEALSEVAAFHADREMAVNRVPPTGWGWVSIQALLDATARWAGRLRMVPQFAKDSGVPDFSAWIHKDFVNHVRSKGLTRGSGAGEQVGASVQLWAADVHHLLESVYRIPYQTHNGSWARWLSPKHPFAEEIHVPMLHISELVTWDYVVGNGDRSPNKNNFVVGGCRQRCKARGKDRDGPLHPGPPTFIHLDNGMCFMYKPQRNPMDNKDWKMCIFHAPLIRRLRELRHGRFADAMQARLPAPVFDVIKRWRLDACQERLGKVLRRVDSCLAEWPRNVVLAT